MLSHFPARALLRSTAAAVLVILGACAGTPEDVEVEPIVFPPPPDEARFFYERTLFNSANVKELDATTRLRMAVTGEPIVGRALAKPFDAVVCKGRIFVSDTVERAILVFDIPGRRYFEIGRKEPGALHKPLGVNVDANCNLYVADGSRAQVLVYDADGRLQQTIGGADWFDRLSHVTPTPDGSRVYAVDTGSLDSQDHRVRVFDARSGVHLHDIGTRGSEPGELNLPRDVAIGPDGALYVVDGANFRIQVFDQDGTFLRSFGDVGRQSGQFSRPKGIAIDAEGRVYVSDAAFGNFQIFTPEGQVLLYVGSRGAKPEPAKYMLPAGIDVDEDGRVYMVDQYFRKVDIYRPADLPQEAGFLGAWYGPPPGQ
jgi:DNA-binding beta-propeller fold protein YncE